MKASKRMKKLIKRLDNIDDDVQALMDEKDYCYLRMRELKADILLEKDALNEAHWELKTNMNSQCYFNLYGGQHCINSDGLKGGWDDIKGQYVQRPKLFKIMSEEEGYEGDFYYINEEEGWTLSSTNGQVTVFFASPTHGYIFMSKYNLKVDSKNIKHRIEELNILLRAQEAALAHDLGITDV